MKHVHTHLETAANIGYGYGIAFKEPRLSNTSHSFLIHKELTEKLDKTGYEKFCDEVKTKRADISSTERFIKPGFNQKMFQLADLTITKSYHLKEIIRAIEVITNANN